MDFAFNDEQEMIRTQAADFLKNECPVDLVRELMESEHGHSQDLWQKIVELGWSALPFPEEYGGLNLTFVDLAIILEEMGKVLLPGNLFFDGCPGGTHTAGGWQQRTEATVAGTTCRREPEGHPGCDGTVGQNRCWGHYSQGRAPG